MLDRRDLLTRATIAGLASGVSSIGALGGCSRSTQHRSEPAAATGSPALRDAPKPLPVPAEGGLPAAFVLGKDAEVLDFCGPLEVFAGAYTKDGKALFAPYMVAATKEPVKVGGGMKVLPDYTFETAPAPRVIVIPAMDDSAAPRQMYDWIRTASRSTDVTMSVCNGAFVLARTGLLSGKPATAHHGGYFRFAGMYPDVHLRRGARFVEDGNIAMAGGISSGIDLALRVVERYLGKEAALELADGMEYQGKGWLNPDSNEAFATMPRFNQEHPLCPLCLMDADRSITATYKGKTYYFCSAGEREFFEAHTDVFDRFQAEDSRRGGGSSRD
ncbi:MAG TPA: DJ-1/PfpI family protein [Thermoanaerobaculia bacterium]|nr:DJ-1/PfpI family protein [Thermoanaerobaculia bacterium]